MIQVPCNFLANHDHEVRDPSLIPIAWRSNWRIDRAEVQLLQMAFLRSRFHGQWCSPKLNPLAGKHSEGGVSWLNAINCARFRFRRILL
jgi:hypothetical protein